MFSRGTRLGTSKRSRHGVGGGGGGEGGVWYRLVVFNVLLPRVEGTEKRKKTTLNPKP